MLERERPFAVGAEDGMTGLDQAVATEAVGGMVTVSHGVHSEALPVGNMTVGDIRRRYADRFDISPLSDVQIDGRPARDDEAVRPGQMLTFLRDAGEKGGGGSAAARRRLFRANIRCRRVVWASMPARGGWSSSRTR